MVKLSIERLFISLLKIHNNKRSFIAQSGYVANRMNNCICLITSCESLSYHQRRN